MSWANDHDRSVPGMDFSFPFNGKEWTPSGDAEEALFDFLSLPLFYSEAVMTRFSRLPGAIVRSDPVASKERFVYVPGNRRDRAVLVAHADTVFDFEYDGVPIPHTLYRDGDVIHACGFPVGADDRAGCALLWFLRNSGHSLLVVDGEEAGCVGSRWLIEENHDIAKEINDHSFMVQFDRRNGNDYKTYNVGTDCFRQFVSETTGFVDAGSDSSTDICELCRDICGVNLSVGYYAPHTFHEHLNVDEWKNTLTIAVRMLSRDLDQFRL